MSMRTKFLRFNKLPKIDTRGNQTPERDRDAAASVHNTHPSASPYRADSLKNTDFFDIFDNLLRKVQQSQPHYVL